MIVLIFAFNSVMLHNKGSTSLIWEYREATPIVQSNHTTSLALSDENVMLCMLCYFDEYKNI